MAQLRRAVEAYREAFDRRLQQRFDPSCAASWNATIGRVAGLTIR
jgi:hypothetical protein